MFNEAELINLIMGIVAIRMLFFFLEDVTFHNSKLFKAGFCSILLSYIFTVVEGIWMQQFFNFLEHLGYAVSGVLFTMALTTQSLSAKTLPSYGEMTQVKQDIQLWYTTHLEKKSGGMIIFPG